MAWIDLVRSDTLQISPSKRKKKEEKERKRTERTKWIPESRRV